MTNKKIKSMLLKEAQDYELVRSKERQSEFGEVFTPTELVFDILKKLPKSVWKEGKTFLDPSCGNAQFLASIALIKKHLGHKKVLETIYGVDILQDNIKECRERLLKIAGDTERNRKIVERNIVCHDALTYDYSFGQDDTPLEVVYEVDEYGKYLITHDGKYYWDCDGHDDRSTLENIAEQENVSVIEVYNEEGKMIYKYNQ